MATSFKNYLVPNIGITATTVYLPTASGIQSTAIGLTLANTLTTSITASVTLVSAGVTVYIVKNSPIPAGNALSLLGDGKIIIEANDYIQVQSSAASSIDALISVVEVI